MTAAGELLRDAAGQYELVGGLARRQQEQESSLDGRPAHWNGSWRMAVAVGEARPAGVRSDVRAALKGARLAEWREGVWVRPANLTDLVEDSRCAWLDAVPDDDPVALANALFAPQRWSRRAGQLLERMEYWTDALRVDPEPAMAGSFLAGALTFQIGRAHV